MQFSQRSGLVELNQSVLPHMMSQALYNYNQQSKFSGLHMPSQPLNLNAGESVSAAYAAMASDPNFAAVLAAALTTIMNGSNNQQNVNNNNSNVTTSNVDNRQ